MADCYVSLELSKSRLRKCLTDRPRGKEMDVDKREQSNSAKNREATCKPWRCERLGHAA